MQTPNQTAKEYRGTYPTEAQLRILLENLFERQRLIELAHRCTTRDPDSDLRQARTDDLIEVLVKAWSTGAKRAAGSLWGAVDQELAGRLKSYLNLGESRLRDMLSTLQSEGSYDRKTAAILMWVLLHENQDNLLTEFESALSHRFRDTGSLLATRPMCMRKFHEIEEQVAGLGRELKALLIEQTREIEGLKNRLQKTEGQTADSAAGTLSTGSETLRRRLENLKADQIRVGVFVDVQNMFYAAKKLDGARLDYESMLDHIIRGRRKIKAVAYIVESSEIDQSGFISVLEKKGYQVRRKELKSFMDGTAKGDWDMGMAIDIIEMASYLDVVALVTGDGDFVSLVRMLKKIGPKVELYAFSHNLSTELKETADEFIEIGSNLLLKNHHHQSAPLEPAQEETRPAPVSGRPAAGEGGKEEGR